MTGCGKNIEVTIPTKYFAKIITVCCGNTSPSGYPWLCEDCERLYKGHNWRREAEEAGNDGMMIIKGK